MNSDKPRKSLIQLTSETKVRDPAAHARHQVVELDKTAKRSQARRKACHDSIEADKKEILHIDEQIQRCSIFILYIHGIQYFCIVCTID